jgi:hypothetical protein
MILRLISILIHVGVAVGISVSGISSGGFMAVQMHVAFSSEVSEAGVVAGGPYLCENIPACTTHPHLIDVDLLEVSTRALASELLIDNTSHLKGSVAHLYSGVLDTVVDPLVVKKLGEYYLRFGVRLHESYNVSSEHGWPTRSYGVMCSELKTPFILKCDFSFPQFMFSGGGMTTGRIIKVPQPGGAVFSMGEYAYVYIPQGEASGVHVSFHGCEQTLSDIGMDYVLNSGLNKYDMIVIYPQAIRTLANPYGCWDWWGYTGPQFATKLSPQMNIVMEIARGFSKVQKK